MDRFQRRQAERELLWSTAAKLWTELRNAVRDLVDSYNGIHEGKKYPATVDDSSTDRIRVDRSVEEAALSITITFVNHVPRFQIGVVWEGFNLVGGDSPKMQKEILKKKSFDMIPDIDEWRIRLRASGEEEELTPHKLVEEVLYNTLIGNTEIQGG